MDVTHVMTAATLLSLLSNKREHVIVFEKELYEAGKATARGESAPWMIWNACMSRAMSEYQTWMDGTSYSCSYVTVQFITQQMVSMHRVSCLNMVERKLLW